MRKRRRAIHVDTDDVEPTENQESETEDIYNEAQLEEMLKDDEITESEYAFMEGREMKPKKEKKSKVHSHDDSVSVELSKQDYEED
jgi:DNA-binding protein H-NS